MGGWLNGSGRVDLIIQDATRSYSVKCGLSGSTKFFIISQTARFLENNLPNKKYVF
jgi:hypothetical protein